MPPRRRIPTGPPTPTSPLRHDYEEFEDGQDQLGRLRRECKKRRLVGVYHLNKKTTLARLNAHGAAAAPAPAPAPVNAPAPADAPAQIAYLTRENQRINRQNNRLSRTGINLRADLATVQARNIELREVLRRFERHLSPDTLQLLLTPTPSPRHSPRTVPNPGAHMPLPANQSGWMGGPPQQRQQQRRQEEIVETVEADQQLGPEGGELQSNEEEDSEEYEREQTPVPRFMNMDTQREMARRREELLRRGVGPSQ